MDVKQIRCASAVAMVAAPFVVSPRARAGEAAPATPHETERIAWEERFDRPMLAWVDPFDHAAAHLAGAYTVQREGGFAFQRALRLLAHRGEAGTHGHGSARSVAEADDAPFELVAR